MRMKDIFLAMIFFSIVPLVSAQNAHKKLMNEPLFFLDSISVAYEEIKQIPTDDIANVSVIKDKAAYELAGEKGKNGIIFIESKSYSRKKFWNMLAAVSESFKIAIPYPGADAGFKYIIKGKQIEDSPAALLGGITEKEIRKVSILSERKMRKKYGVKDKKGVLIRIS